jgi:hypothetical protein
VKVAAPKPRESGAKAGEFQYLLRLGKPSDFGKKLVVY